MAGAASTWPSPPLLPLPHSTVTLRAWGQRERKLCQALEAARCISAKLSMPLAMVRRSSSRTWAALYKGRNDEVLSVDTVSP